MWLLEHQRRRGFMEDLLCQNLEGTCPVLWWLETPLFLTEGIKVRYVLLIWGWPNSVLEIRLGEGVTVLHLSGLLLPSDKHVRDHGVKSCRLVWTAVLKTCVSWVQSLRCVFQKLLDFQQRYSGWICYFQSEGFIIRVQSNWNMLPLDPPWCKNAFQLDLD
jgi:hypothetical protein